MINMPGTAGEVNEEAGRDGTEEMMKDMNLEFDHPDLPDEFITRIIKESPSIFRDSFAVDGVGFSPHPDYLMRIFGVDEMAIENRKDMVIHHIRDHFDCIIHKQNTQITPNEYHHCQIEIDRLVRTHNCFNLGPIQKRYGMSADLVGEFILRREDPNPIRISILNMNILEGSSGVIACPLYEDGSECEFSGEITRLAGADHDLSQCSNQQLTVSFRIKEVFSTVEHILHFEVNSNSVIETMQSIFESDSLEATSCLSIPLFDQFEQNMNEGIHSLLLQLATSNSLPSLNEIRLICDDLDALHELIICIEELESFNPTYDDIGGVFQWKFRTDLPLNEQEESNTIDQGKWDEYEEDVNQKVEVFYQEYMKTGHTGPYQIDNGGIQFLLYFDDPDSYQENISLQVNHRIQRVASEQDNNPIILEGNYVIAPSRRSLFDFMAIYSFDEVDVQVCGVEVNALIENFRPESFHQESVNVPPTNFRVIMNSICRNQKLSIDGAQSTNETIVVSMPPNSKRLVKRINQQLSAISNANITRFPDTWEESKTELVNIPLTDPEVAHLIAEWSKTMNAASIKKIERIQQYSRFRSYALKRMDIEMKPYNNGDPNEIWAWHGTRSTDPQLIITNGFDPRYSRAGSLGEAAYFSTQASYSAGSYRSTNSSGDYQVFFVTVTLGRVHEGSHKGKVQPSGFDSVQNGHMHTVYETNMAYPHYLVTFN